MSKRRLNLPFPLTLPLLITSIPTTRRPVPNRQVPTRQNFYSTFSLISPLISTFHLSSTLWATLVVSNQANTGSQSLPIVIFLCSSFIHRTPLQTVLAALHPKHTPLPIESVEKTRGEFLFPIWGAGSEDFAYFSFLFFFHLYFCKSSKRAYWVRCVD